MRPLGFAWRRLANGAGCCGSALRFARVGPNYRRPEVIVPAELAKTRRSSATSLGDLGWWGYFPRTRRCTSCSAPPSWPTATSRVAVGASPRVAAHSSEVARRRPSSPRSMPAPATSTRAPNSEKQPLPERLEGPLPPSPETTSRPASTLAFELDLWGAACGGATEAARAELLAREENRRARTHHAGVRCCSGRTSICSSWTRSWRSPGARSRPARSPCSSSGRRFQQGLSHPGSTSIGLMPKQPWPPPTVPDLERRIAQNEKRSERPPGAAIPVPSLAAHRSTGNGCRRRLPAGLPSALLERPARHSPGRTDAGRRQRPNRCGKRRNTSQRSRSQECWASRACRCPTSSPGGHGFWSIGPAITVPLFTAGADQEHRQGL